MQGSSLPSLQQRLAGIQYITLDEVSMLSQRTISWVYRRLRQATGHQHKPFGGLSIILVGDLGQLPPVGDCPHYAPEGTGTHGHTLYQLFTTVVILEQVMRQAGNDHNTNAFRKLLMNLDDGKVTEDEWTSLLQRSPTTAIVTF